MKDRTGDESIIADPELGPEAFVGAKRLCLHRMMKRQGPHWDGLSHEEKRQLAVDAAIILGAAKQCDWLLKYDGYMRVEP